MRSFAVSELEKIFPGSGAEHEMIVFTTIQNDMEYKNGWDFYDFRKEYKRLLKSFLRNYRREDSNLKSKLDSGEWDFTNAIGMSRLEWEPQLWVYEDHDFAETVDTGEVRKGLFACKNCQNKGVYAYNTNSRDVQTRSADEPATIFLECFTCGKKAKFSS